MGRKNLSGAAVDAGTSVGMAVSLVERAVPLYADVGITAICHCREETAPGEMR